MKPQNEKEAHEICRRILFLHLITILAEDMQLDRKSHLTQLVNLLYENEITPMYFIQYINIIGYGNLPEHTQNLMTFGDVVSELRDQDILTNYNNYPEQSRIAVFREVFVKEGRLATVKEINDMHRERVQKGNPNE